MLNEQESRQKEPESVSNSFFNNLGAGAGPQEPQQDGPGYLKIKADTASRLLTIASRELKRKRRLRAKRQRRWYYKNALRKALENPPPAKHPISASAEVRAIEEVLELA